MGIFSRDALAPLIAHRRSILFSGASLAAFALFDGASVSAQVESATSTPQPLPPSPEWVRALPTGPDTRSKMTVEYAKLVALGIFGRPISTACSGGFLQYLRKPLGHIQHNVVAAGDLVGAPALLPRAGQVGVKIGDGDAGLIRRLGTFVAHVPPGVSTFSDILMSAHYWSYESSCIRATPSPPCGPILNITPCGRRRGPRKSKHSRLVVVTDVQEAACT
jgi:hypothetical protein